jgi:tetratricopeptide (TPR) repeat protein
MTSCEDVGQELAELVDEDQEAIARHAAHLAGCESCRDARYEATRVVASVAGAGADYVAPGDLLARLLAAVDREAATPMTPMTAMTAPNGAAAVAGAAMAAPNGAAGTPGDAIAGAVHASRVAGPPRVTERGWHAKAPAPPRPPATRRLGARVWLAIGAGVAVAAGGAGVVLHERAEPVVVARAADAIATLTRIDGAGGHVEVRDGAAWRALRADERLFAGAELRTDERTRAALTLTDGTSLVLDQRSALALGAARRLRLAAGRLAADVTHVEGQVLVIDTPSGRVDVVGTQLTVAATEALTSVQVTRGAVVLTSARGEHDDVRAGEEGMIERGALTVSAAPGLVRERAWAELGQAPGPEEATAGLGALRAYKPGEQRDRDWNLALADHDVKVRVVGPIARTEITETFRNDSAATLEGVYQFPLPPDAQIDRLALDVAGGFVDGAFVDKERGAKIWRGVIDKASPKIAARPTQEIIWVEGRWRDPALLDWKRGGRFELRVYPIPAHGARTIKLAYTQVVTPRGSWRQYSYPLPHSRDGSTVADRFSFDIELRGAAPGRVRTAGYALVADPARAAVNALGLQQAGFVPHGDLVVDYRPSDGDAELRAWTFAGGAAAAPDDKLAAKRNVGIDPKVVAAQRALAADVRPTAVMALRPKLPRWQAGEARDYEIVVDSSQSMVGERFTRATELAAAIVAQMDRRDRFAVMTCDSECRSMAALGAPSSQAAGEVQRWLAAQVPAGASDVVAALRAARQSLGQADGRASHVLYIGDGFASTGFRRIGDVEQAVGAGARITTIGIGSDADAAVLAAAARGGGGSYLAWVPGQRAQTAAAAALEATMGAALEGAVIELPAGLVDVAPSALPTVRAGDEVLIAARMTGAVAGDVVVRGTVAGQPFEQRYPVTLAASAAAGNRFVPRLWAQLAIEQLERTGSAEDRSRIVALSQGMGVMSRETSLLVLESQAMFDAFGVDRGTSGATWTGEEALDEVASAGTVALDTGDRSDDDKAASGAGSGKGRAPAHRSEAKADRRSRGDDFAAAPPAPPAASRPATVAPEPVAPRKKPPADAAPAGARNAWDGPGKDWVQLRRIWVRVPSVTAYDTVHPSIAQAISHAEAALAASPDSREKHRALVQALAYAGELDRAREVAQRWLDRDQLDPQALGALADLLGRGGERERALRTLAGLVDLDADRVALHERMVRAYEQAGRLAQACSHRIAIAALSPQVPVASAGALRCLRGLGRDRDAQLILHALPDDAVRAAVEKAALVAPIAAPVTGDLVVRAHWTVPADLDLTLVTPEGARVSWMGGRSDVVTGDVTSTDHEALAIKALRRGNYLVEISRTAGAAGGTIRGTLDIVALGARRALPFELTGARAVVGRVSVRLDERFEELDGRAIQLYNGPDRRIIPDRR